MTSKLVTHYNKSSLAVVATSAPSFLRPPHRRHTKMILRIRSRDGLERVTVPNPSTTIVAGLKSLIEEQLQVPVPSQTLSLDQNLLVPKPGVVTPTLSDSPLLSSLGLSNGSFVYLAYEGERTVRGPAVFTPAGSFGRKMTVEDIVARQMRVSRQENPHFYSVFFDRNARGKLLRQGERKRCIARDGVGSQTGFEISNMPLPVLRQAPKWD